MHDGVSLESAGVPTAVVVTGEFVHEAGVQRAALGMDALEPVVIEHPLSTLTEAQVAERVAQALPQIRRILLGEGAR